MHTTPKLRSAAVALMLASIAGCSRTVSSPPTIVPNASSAISVVAAAVRTTYTGQCPPSSERAPSFEAIISVTHGPLTITYQWLTGDASGSDPSVRMITFDGSGPQQSVVAYTETAFAPDRTRADWAALIVRSPLAVESNHVAFTTSCHTAGPHRYGTDGDSKVTTAP